MSNEIAVVRDQAVLSAGEIRAHVNRVQEVMKAVMQKDVHYGVIPGSKKPSLYKPGAEVLCATFRIAPSFKIEDLSNGDAIRYRIAAVATHQTSSVVLGEGVGECSSNEEKYKWRRAVCAEEFEDTPVDRRRVKYSKYQGKVEKTQQVRTEPADIANTVLKMAVKRAQVAMTLNVLAASDCFTQDIEDLPPELQEREDAARAEPPPPATWPADKFAAIIEKHGPSIKAGTKTPADLIKWLEAKAPITDAQRAQVNALAPVAPIEGDVLTDAEIAAIHEREMKEAA